MAKTSVGNLAVKLTADARSFTAGLKKASESAAKFEKDSGKKLSKFSKNAMKAFAAVTAAATAFGAAVIANNFAISEMARESQALGLAAKDYQAIAFAAKAAGISSDVLTDAITEMNKKIGEAKNNTGELVNLSKQMGFGLDQFLTGDTEASLRAALELARQLDTESRTNFFDKLFGGTAGRRMLRLLDMPQSEVDRLLKQGRAGALTESQLQAAQGAQQAMSELAATAKQFWDRWSTSFAPLFETAANVIISKFGKKPIWQQLLEQDEKAKARGYRPGSMFGGTAPLSREELESTLTKEKVDAMLEESRKSREILSAIRSEGIPIQFVGE